MTDLPKCPVCGMSPALRVRCRGMNWGPQKLGALTVVQNGELDSLFRQEGRGRLEESLKITGVGLWKKLNAIIVVFALMHEKGQQHRQNGSTSKSAI